MSPVFLNPAARTQMLAPAVLSVLGAVFLMGFVSLGIAWMPISLGDAQWRLGAAYGLLGAAPQMAFMLMMIALTAAYGGNYRVLRWSAVVSLLLGVFFLAVILFFALDFLAARHLQSLESLGKFTREGLRLCATSGVLALLLLWAGRRAWMAAERDPEGRNDVGHGLIVAQEEPRM